MRRRKPCEALEVKEASWLEASVFAFLDASFQISTKSEQMKDKTHLIKAS
jgi:hypothetical protein